MNVMKEYYGWKDGDEIIVPAVTWVTNISPVFQSGLTPVFSDINLEDFSFDYEMLEKKITDKTRAIFVTHLIGFPANISRIKEIIGKRDIHILEDCCESHGAVFAGSKIGNHGTMSSFSFYWGHHMTTVEGGMLCTDNEDLYKLAVLKRSHGLARELPAKYHEPHKEKYSHINFNFLFLTDGYNFRNTELHAALGIAQLKHLDRYIDIRNKNHVKFLEIIAPYKEYLSMPDARGISSFCLPFLLKTKASKDRLHEKFRIAGIESRPVISGNLMHQPFIQRFNVNPLDFPNAEFLHQNAFYIGNNQFVGEDRLEMLGNLLREFKNDGGFDSE
jgi:CDP-6-deoxy-D-xylo-4-hexulose-3-dehydrase